MATVRGRKTRAYAMRTGGEGGQKVVPLSLFSSFLLESLAQDPRLREAIQQTYR